MYAHAGPRLSAVVYGQHLGAVVGPASGGQTRTRRRTKISSLVNHEACPRRHAWRRDNTWDCHTFLRALSQAVFPKWRTPTVFEVLLRVSVVVRRTTPTRTRCYASA